MEGTYQLSHIKIEKNYKESQTKNIKECLQENARTKTDVEAFIFVSTDGGRQSVTWLELYERSCSTARSMIQLGVKSSEIVAINLRTCPQWLYATFGAMFAGAIPVSISFTYTDGSDFVAMMEKLEFCSLLVMDPGLDNINWKIVEGHLDEFNKNGEVKSTKLRYLRYLVGVNFENCLNRVKPFVELLDRKCDNTDLPGIDSGDVAFMLQTSGSTGVPKLVVHTHASLVSVAASDLCALDSKSLIFNDRPFNWLGGFPVSVVVGQSRVTISGFCEAPKDRVAYMKEVIVKEQCSLVVALPPLMADLIRSQDQLPKDWPVVGLLSGGQPMTKSLTECIGKVGKFLLCAYGSSEAFILTQNKVTDCNSFTEYGCGIPLKIRGLEMKVVDENGQIVPVNTSGEIYARSPGMFKEYFNDPEKTKAVKTTNGWYKTDDVGRMTEKGEFFVEGRKSNMIISGGMVVAPEILEQVMKTFPMIESVVLVPVPDVAYYQVICACVVRKPGFDITEEQLRKCCEDFYTDKPGLFTVLPKFYLFLDKLPETYTGKTGRKELERIACSMFM